MTSLWKALGRKGRSKRKALVTGENFPLSEVSRGQKATGPLRETKRKVSNKVTIVEPLVGVLAD